MSHAPQDLTDFTAGEWVQASKRYTLPAGMQAGDIVFLESIHPYEHDSSSGYLKIRDHVNPNAKEAAFAGMFGFHMFNVLSEEEQAAASEEEIAEALQSISSAMRGK